MATKKKTTTSKSSTAKSSSTGGTVTTTKNKDGSITIKNNSTGGSSTVSSSGKVTTTGGGAYGSPSSSSGTPSSSSSSFNKSSSGSSGSSSGGNISLTPEQQATYDASVKKYGYADPNKTVGSVATNTGSTGTGGINEYSTLDGHKLVQGETYVNAQGQTVTQGTPIAGQMGAILDPNTPPPVAPVAPVVPEVPDTKLSELEQQFKALLGQSEEEKNAVTEEEIARQAIENQDNSLRQGVQNVGEQPIGMSFISGQQADLEKRNTNLQIPLQQKLELAQRNRALAQERNQASLDSVRFSLERADKKSEQESKTVSQSDLYGTGAIGEYNFAKSQGYTGSFTQYQNEDANRKAKASGSSTSNGTESERKSANYATINQILALPIERGYVDANGYITAQGFKDLVANAIEDNISRKEFLEQYAHRLYPKGGKAYGLSAKEMLDYGIEKE